MKSAKSTAALAVAALLSCATAHAQIYYSLSNHDVGIGKANLDGSDNTTFYSQNDGGGGLAAANGNLYLSGNSNFGTPSLSVINQANGTLESSSSAQGNYQGPVAVIGNDVLVDNVFNKQIDEYSLGGQLEQADLVTLPSEAIVMASSGSDLFFDLGGSIGEYNLATKTLNASFITVGAGDSITALAVIGGNLLVGDNTAGAVEEYNLNGDQLSSDFLSDQPPVEVTAFAQDGNDLLVATQNLPGQTPNTSDIREYDLSGNLVDQNFLTGLAGNTVTGIVVIAAPEPSSYALVLVGLSVIVGLLRRRRS